MEVVDLRVKYLRPKYDNYSEWLYADDRHIYIGRAINRPHLYCLKSKWYNPFTMRQCKTRQEICEKYEEYIRKSELYDQLEELDGKILGCWCVGEHNECHGLILIKLLNEKKNK